ncbi:uncharacterized protein ARMOST_04388 [Armillaria ostoyae]|uniref:Uncharacterized protein n=1 Tax=Armillaria ostoyae TaxID=47428 RepID=A0A284QXD8_ARMOS|nr:uncharacterized protein ARMOST_04388 [Armillaria ostoyae]
MARPRLSERSFDVTSKLPVAAAFQCRGTLRTPTAASLVTVDSRRHLSFLSTENIRIPCIHSPFNLSSTIGISGMALSESVPSVDIFCFCLSLFGACLTPLLFNVDDSCTTMTSR